MDSISGRHELVERLEREMREAPLRYRLKLALLALLGYAVMGLALVMTLGLTVFLLLYLFIVRPPASPAIAIPLVVLGSLGVILLRALWVRFDAPAGHRLAPHEAGELCDEVERVRRQVGAGRLHGIVIDAEMNAAAAYVPQGLWGRRHYLVLGLPLLRTLRRDELAAVIAHEFGHFHGRHERFANWILRLRYSLYRLQVATGGGAMLSSGQLLWLFLRWYAPYFETYSLVLARRHEFAADAVAAEVAGAPTAASALGRIGLAADWLEREFWPQTRRSAQAQSYPPVQVYERLLAGLDEQRRQWSRIPRWLLEREAGPDDTHPSLRQRLAALGAAPTLLDPEVAASSLLGEELAQTLERRFSEQWRQHAAKEWEAQHRQAQAETRRLDELRALARHSPAEAVEYAGLVETYRPVEDAVPLYRQALEQLPAHATGHYRLGALLLERGEEAEGLARLQQAMQLDAAVVEPALHRLHDHLRQQPDDAGVHALATELRARHAMRTDAAVTGKSVAPTGALAPHALDAEQLQALARVLGGFDRIKAAWLVRAPADGLSALPHHLLLLDWAGSVASEAAALPRLAGQVRLPGTFAVSTTTGDAALAWRIKPLAEPVYRRR